MATSELPTPFETQVLGRNLDFVLRATVHRVLADDKTTVGSQLLCHAMSKIQLKHERHVVEINSLFSTKISVSKRLYSSSTPGLVCAGG